MANDELKVLVRAEVDKAVRDLQRVDSSMQGTESSASRAAIGFGVVAAAVGTAVVAIRGAVNAARELTDAYAVQERAEAKIAGVLRATGHAAGFNSDQLEEMASSLQGVTTFGDEAILNMQSILLTFKSLQGEGFERSTELALDLSAAFDQDLRSSALQLGKALEDPATGLTALRRVGVSFTEAQREMIEAMTEAGDVAGAQTVILDTLESQVGGVARELAATKSGGLEQLNNLVGDLRENFGFFILDALEPSIDAFTILTEKANELFSNLRQRREDADVLADALSGFGDADAYERAMQVLQGQMDQTQADLMESSRLIRQLEQDESVLEVAIEEERWARAEILSQLSEQESKMEYLRGVHAELAEEEEARAEAEREAADQAEREAEARRRQLEIEQEYREARGEVVKLLEAEKTERDRILEQIEYLEGYRWAAGSEMERDRAQALEILRRRLAELDEQERVAVDTSIQLAMSFGLVNDGIDLAEGGLLRLGAITGEAADETQGLTDKYRELEKELKDIPKDIDLKPQIESESERAAEAMREQFAQAAMDIGGMLASEIGSALSGDAFDLEGILRSSVGSVADILMPGAGGLAAGLFDLAAGAWDALTGVSQESIEAAAEEARNHVIELDDAYRSEIDIRNEYLDELQDVFGVEFDVLRDQWQRGRITSQEFREGMAGLNEEYGAAEGEAEGKAAMEAKKDIQAARNEKLRGLRAARNELQAELDAMSGWDKFWSGRDEELQAEIDVYNARIAAAKQATTLSGVQSAARGANFMTDGPELLLVGDNPGGREHVMVTPAPGSPGGLTININAPVYGVDHLYEILDEAGRRLQRRGRIA
ncbi:MAG: phage tail length tape measure family protein [bacterium]